MVSIAARSKHGFSSPLESIIQNQIKDVKFAGGTAKAAPDLTSFSWIYKRRPSGLGYVWTLMGGIG